MSIYSEYNQLNIIFLDIDEVLNCNRDLKSDKEHKNLIVRGQKHHDRFNPKLIANLNKLIERYDLKIVLSSTWRKLFDIITMNEIFAEQMGIKGTIIDYTTKEYLDTDYRDRLEWEGNDASPRDRGLQITKWLREGKYNVKNYIVLDDSLDASYGHEDFYHRTFGEYGFDEDSYNKCIEKFDKIFGVNDDVLCE